MLACWHLLSEISWHACIVHYGFQYGIINVFRGSLTVEGVCCSEYFVHDVFCVSLGVIGWRCTSLQRSRAGKRVSSVYLKTVLSPPFPLFLNRGMALIWVMPWIKAIW